MFDRSLTTTLPRCFWKNLSTTSAKSSIIDVWATEMKSKDMLLRTKKKKKEQVICKNSRAFREKKLRQSWMIILIQWLKNRERSVVHIVDWGIKPSLKNTTPKFFVKPPPPLKSANKPPLFRQFPLYCILFFCETPS